MKRAVKRILICMIMTGLIWCGMLILDKNRMQEELIRLHVVANSNDPADQTLKHCVCDAVIQDLQNDLKNIYDADQAKKYIESRLPYIASAAENALKDMGCDEAVEVSFRMESFDTQHSDTIALPAGIYNALRIVIGNGQGENWWGVIFPETISIASSQNKREIAAGVFEDGPEDLLISASEWNIRFGIMEVIGKLENMLFAG